MGSGLSARVGAAHRHIVYCDGKPSILLVYVLSIFYGKILQFLLKACVLFVCLLVTMAGCGIVIILARRPCDTWFDTWTWKPFVRQRGERRCWMFFLVVVSRVEYILIYLDIYMYVCRWLVSWSEPNSHLEIANCEALGNAVSKCN